MHEERRAPGLREVLLQRRDARQAALAVDRHRRVDVVDLQKGDRRRGARAPRFLLGSRGTNHRPASEAATSAATTNASGEPRTPNRERRTPNRANVDRVTCTDPRPDLRRGRRCRRSG